MSLPTVLAVLLPTVPGAAGLAGLLVRPAARRTAAALGIAATAVALVAAVALTALRQTATGSVTLADLGDVTVHVGVRVDPVAAAVAVAVGTVALLVQVYSVAYLDRDDRYAPYAAQVSLFCAAMLTVVVASDLIQLLVGWEVMGICSYLLIAHDRTLPEAPAAAVKAFLVTRVGDVGFWLGVILLGTGADSFRIDDVIRAAASGELSHARVTAACLLLLAGVAGKSAQFPLHTWLPDAMAGPTPISALIHAATMVAAGIYVVARLYPLFLGAPAALTVLGVMAAVTMLLGALAATAQDDIKRVLAWSTVSQLAYMAGALAAGSDQAAIFHLLTHAAFKALLFLAAGSVIHAAGTNLMSRMGGLRRGMPVTFWTMTVGLAALAGVPPFAGFWSKEAVLDAAARGSSGTVLASLAPVHLLVLVAGLVTVAITAWYATRLWLRTFFGASRGAAGHEPARTMWIPLVVLAVPAVGLGALTLVPRTTEFGWFAYAPARHFGVFTAASGYGRGAFGGAELDPVVVAISLAMTAAGVLGAYLLWRRDTAADPARVLGRAGALFAAGFRLDDVQRALVVRPVQAVATAVWLGDARVVDGGVTGTARGARRLGRTLARLHTGLPGYLTAVLAGALVLGLVAVLVGGVR
ncbi:NADH-quinone oxidoreductase subunit 5 family protein [Actinocatenispora rupis]|uniref:NADH dehydrogenase n=1 Tax=Actinocatenispora rupis TaxID=519421 RepID=A0A8J3JFE5_9ACTN|nr:NADH-quinone oxidoreductase subunit L [Actinocatenispora rupis]GID15684.1 NADH dehydrogenase [Actinocatenispora rupis]